MEGPSGDDKEAELPKQSVVRAAKNSGARDFMLSGELQLGLVAAATEFVHLVTSEATLAGEKAGKKTLTPDLIIEACVRLGFADYATLLREVAEHADETARVAREKKKSSQNVCTPEERARLQKELFAAAAQQMKGEAPPPPPPPSNNSNNNNNGNNNAK